MGNRCFEDSEGRKKERKDEEEKTEGDEKS